MQNAIFYVIKWAIRYNLEQSRSNCYTLLRNQHDTMGKIMQKFGRKWRFTDCNIRNNRINLFKLYDLIITSYDYDKVT